MGTFIADTSNEAYTFDSILSEQWSEPANVTEHPIDSRAPVSDHIQLLALTGTINAVVSMTPFDIQVSAQSVDETIAAIRDASNTVDAPAEGVRRLIDAIEFFRRNRQDTFTYIGARIGAVENLAIENVDYPVTVREDMRFTIEVRQIRIATGVEVDLPPVVVVPPKAKPIKECSVQSTEDAGDGDGEGRSNLSPRLQSAAFRSGEWAGSKMEDGGGLGSLLDSQKSDYTVIGF